MEQIGGWFNEVISNIGNDKILADIAGEVKKLCDKFPIYK